MTVQNQNHITLDLVAKSLDVPKGQLATVVLLQILHESAKSLLDAPAQNPATGKSLGSSAPSTSSSSNPSEDILESILTAIEMSFEVRTVSQKTVRTVLDFVMSQAETLQSLAEQIQNLKKQLGGNLTPQQIAKLTQELDALEAQYQTALSEWDSASKDSKAKQSDEANEQKAYNDYKKQYNQMKDKSSPAAKKLKSEMDAAQGKITADQQAIVGDRSKMASAQAAMTQVSNSLASLAKANPSLEAQIKAIISAISQEKPASCFNSILGALKAMAAQDTTLEAQIADKEQEQTALIQVLSQSSTLVGNALKQYLRENHGVIVQKKIISILNRFIQSKSRIQDHHKEQVECENASLVHSTRQLEENHKKIIEKEKKLKVILENRAVRG